MFFILSVMINSAVSWRNSNSRHWGRKSLPTPSRQRTKAAAGPDILTWIPLGRGRGLVGLCPARLSKALPVGPVGTHRASDVSLPSRLQRKWPAGRLEGGGFTVHLHLNTHTHTSIFWRPSWKEAAQRRIGFYAGAISCRCRSMHVQKHTVMTTKKS